MLPLDVIKNKLASVPLEKLNLGYRQVNFIRPENLEDEQISFTHQFNGIPFQNQGEGSWKKSWIVIATDEIGAPVFLDAEDGIVYTASRENNRWQVFRVANSIELYFRFIEIMSKLSEGRETPEDFRVNPVPEKVADAIMTEIEKHAVDCDIWYWELFLEDLWQDPEEAEGL